MEDPVLPADLCCAVDRLRQPQMRAQEYDDPVGRTPIATADPPLIAADGERSWLTAGWARAGSAAMLIPRRLRLRRTGYGRPILPDRWATRATDSWALGEGADHRDVGLFGFDDTAGTLLEFRGWALHHEKATEASRQPLPPLDDFMRCAQAPFTSR